MSLSVLDGTQITETPSEMSTPADLSNFNSLLRPTDISPWVENNLDDLKRITLGAARERQKYDIHCKTYDEENFRRKGKIARILLLIIGWKAYPVRTLPSIFKEQETMLWQFLRKLNKEEKERIKGKIIGLIGYVHDQATSER